MKKLNKGNQKISKLEKDLSNELKKIEKLQSSYAKKKEKLTRMIKSIESNKKNKGEDVNKKQRRINVKKDEKIKYNLTLTQMLDGMMLYWVLIFGTFGSLMKAFVLPNVLPAMNIFTIGLEPVNGLIVNLSWICIICVLYLIFRKKILKICGEIK